MAWFAKLCKEVFGARAEANDNLRYLRPLETWYEQLEGAGLEDLPALFRPVLHMLLLVWKNSRFYNSPNRLVVMVREICNTLIASAVTFINGEAEERGISSSAMGLYFSLCFVGVLAGPFLANFLLRFNGPLDIVDTELRALSTEEN